MEDDTSLEERHQEFGEARLAKTELFEPTEDLLAHIEVVRMTFGDPAKFWASSGWWQPCRSTYFWGRQYDPA